MVKSKLNAEYPLNRAIDMKNNPETNIKDFISIWFRTFFNRLIVYNKGMNQNSTPIIIKRIDNSPYL